MPLCRDSAMIFLFFIFFVKMCGARGWFHMLICTLLPTPTESIPTCITTQPRTQSGLGQSSASKTTTCIFAHQTDKRTTEAKQPNQMHRLLRPKHCVCP